MLSLIKRVTIFLTFFLVFGLIGVLADAVTGYKYGIRDQLTAAVEQSRSMTARWVRSLKKGWWWSPVLALGFILSPVLFIFALLLALHDLYRQDQVYWDEGTRIVYPGGPLTEADILKNPKTTQSWFRQRLAGILGNPDLSGVLYCGEPVPRGWTPENLLDEETRRLGLANRFRRIGIAGQYWYAPPANEDQDISILDDHWKEI